MSIYKTLSCADLLANKINFTLRNHESNLHDPYFYLNDALTASAESIILLLDEFTSPSPVPVTLRYPKAAKPDSNPPLVTELRNAIPAIFEANRSLDEYFHGELFFAANLAAVSDSFLNKDFAFPGHLILNPSSFSDNETKHMLADIHTKVADFKALVMNHNSRIILEYGNIIQVLKLTILSNSRIFKNFENSRVMFESLLKVKHLLDLNEYSSELDIAVSDLGDAIYDYNQYVEDKGTNASTLSGSTASTIYSIESELNPHSQFITNDCARLLSLLDEVKLSFSEYVDNFHKRQFGASDYYQYEIVSFDDHLKSQL